MKRMRILLILGAGLLAAAVLAACSAAVSTPAPSDNDVLLTAQAGSPLPTQLAGEGLSVVGTKACQVQKLVSVQVDKPQGDMAAWSPAGNTLAYVTPGNEKWGWFVGNLVLLDVPNNKVTYTTSDIRVAGDLTWSPDGKKLAFVVLDPTEKIYNVDILDLESQAITELFSVADARTDEWSSPKGINQWISANLLEVMSSCGVDCSRAYDYNTATSQMITGSEGRKQDDHSLEVSSGGASPDGTWQVTVDTKDNVWLSAAGKHQASIILTGNTVGEIKWSGDSSYLALRVDEAVLIFEPVCKNK